MVKSKRRSGGTSPVVQRIRPYRYRSDENIPIVEIRRSNKPRAYLTPSARGMIWSEAKDISNGALAGTLQELCHYYSVSPKTVKRLKSRV